MKRLIFAAAMVWASVAGAQVTLTGDVRNAAGQTVQLTPQGLFVQSCNAGAGGIVGQDACTLPTDGGGGGGGGGAVTGAAGAFVDGWSATDGLTTDIVCATDTGACTEVQLFKRLNVSMSTLAAAVGDSLPAGTAIVGKFGIDQTTPGTTNAVSVTNLPTTVDTNAGAAGASTTRVVLATGGASQAVTNAGTFAVQAASTLQTQTDTVMVGGINVKEINAVTPLMGNGTTGTGSQRVTIASDNTAFTVNAVDTNAGTFAVQAQPTPVTSGGLSTFSEIVPANTTSVVVKSSAGQIYDIEMGSNASTPLSSPLYVKLYDAAQGSTTCGSGTPKARYVFTGGSNVSIPLGEAYATAITACVTAGIADNDATNPAATTFLLTVHYK